LGRPLTDADLVDVRWTVHAPADDTILDKTDRRRHILQRLLSQAREQNAAPTDADLARALGVSRRTIERDMAALQAAGQGLSTRRRPARRP
jgi:biotin operon repressor